MNTVIKQRLQIKQHHGISMLMYQQIVQEALVDTKLNITISICEPCTTQLLFISGNLLVEYLMKRLLLIITAIIIMCEIHNRILALKLLTLFLVVIVSLDSLLMLLASITLMFRTTPKKIYWWKNTRPTNTCWNS